MEQKYSSILRGFNHIQAHAQKCSYLLLVRLHYRGTMQVFLCIANLLLGHVHLVFMKLVKK